MSKAFKVDKEKKTWRDVCISGGDRGKQLVVTVNPHTPDLRSVYTLEGRLYSSYDISDIEYKKLFRNAK